jgi:hypothetical protein
VISTVALATTLNISISKSSPNPLQVSMTPSIPSIQAIQGGGSELPRLTGLMGLTAFHHHINSLLLSPRSSKAGRRRRIGQSGLDIRFFSGLMGRLCYRADQVSCLLQTKFKFSSSNSRKMQYRLARPSHTHILCCESSMSLKYSIKLCSDPCLPLLNIYYGAFMPKERWADFSGFWS